YLRESLRLDGQADVLNVTVCPSCGAQACPDRRCVDCFAADMCRSCAVKWHKYNPLHRIYRHNGDFYEREDQHELGIRIQLVHPPGEVCPTREWSHVKDFAILHTNGIHHLRVDFCSCALGKDIPRPIQLMRRRLWPATVVDPQTATSFEALDDFTRLSLLGRLSAYDYHKAAQAATDGAALKGLADIRQQFMTCIHEFRHIMLFKRAGRGHEPGSIAKTPAGACAVRCPACPNVEMNMEAGWEKNPLQWLFRMCLSLDANFRLSNRLSRSTNKTDPNLNDGKAYLSPSADYREHLKQIEGVDAFAEQPSDCSRFGAINMANNKGGRGLRTTGVAACICRHEMLQPLGVATLRKGERYSTMDYVFNGSVTFARAPCILVTYDIACQWHKRLQERLAKIPEEREIYGGAVKMLGFMTADKAVFCVPKFHLYAHRIICQLGYALGWTDGAGALDGEGPERVWSGTNPAASSLREMGPGTMYDTLDDILGAWNWQKLLLIYLIRVGKALAERMERAVAEGREQAAIFTEFTEALEDEDRSITEKWRRLVKAWEATSSEPPASATAGSSGGDDMKTAAATDCDHEHAEAATTFDFEEQAARAQFLLLGLKIESDRYRIESKRGEDGQTITQATARTQTLNALVRDIERFRSEQERFMPAVYASLTVEERHPDRSTAQTVKLWMPYELPMNDESVPAETRAMAIKLLWASMEDELEDLLHQLRLRGCLNRFKLKNITGQRANTRARTAQDAVDANVKTAAHAYRRHRAAYMALVGPDDQPNGWEKTMRVLEDSDCRGLGDRLIEQIDDLSIDNARQFVASRRDNGQAGGETLYHLPWIWYKAGFSGDNDKKISDELMVEWCKSRARARSWVQEAWILDEEMGRVLRFNESLASIW
ncbi:hypothetical protein PENSPDRAFT_563397, partial [Peniophora sp. CONT]